ncbi:MAG: hypothetical protein NT013_30435, partial [Planctomycetia bacterium]|nr:hypothetical protein [Planctomycetia bacterium]
PDHRPCTGRSILSQVRPSTGEPDAGNPPVRFGGRGDRNQSVVPTPITLDLNGGQVRVRDANGVVVQSYPQSDNDFLLINGTDAGDETLIVDFSGGNPIPFFGLAFDGGEGLNDNDFVRVQGYNLNTADGNADVIVNHDGAENGFVNFAGLGTIFFDNIEPLILAGTAADLVINLPAGGNPDVLLANNTLANFPLDGTNAVDGRSAIDGSTFEYTEFVNPTNSLTINLGNNGDTLTIGAMDAGFAPTANSTIQGGAANDTLVGQNATATWNLTAPIRTYVSGGLTWQISSLETLQGGSGVDTFNVTAPHAGSLLGGLGNDIFRIDSQVTLSLGVGGVVNGQGGSDTLQGNIISAVVITNADANGFDGTEADIVGGFNDVETINGNGGASSTITGNNSSAIWDLDGTPTYTTNGNTLNVSAFGTLIGGNVDDRFNVTAPSAFTLQGAVGDDIFDIDAVLTGNVDGGLGSNTLQGNVFTNSVITNLDGTGADGTALGAVTGGYVEIDNLFGTAAVGGTLTGLPNAVSTWNLSLAPTYVVGANSVGFSGFSGFSNLQGGTALDTFNATANNSNYNIFAGDGDDVVVVAAGATLTGNVNTEAGNDTVRFAANTGNIVGNVNFGSSGTLDYSALASPVSVTLNAVGVPDGFNGLAGGASLISGTFSNLTTLLGGTGSDTLTGQNAAATWQLNGLLGFQGVYQSGGQSLSFSGQNSLVGNLLFIANFLAEF